MCIGFFRIMYKWFDPLSLCFFNFNNFKLGQNWREFGFLKAVNKRSVESKKFFNAKKKWKRIIWAHWSTFGSFRSFFKVIDFSFLFVSLPFTKKKGLHVHSVEIAEFFRHFLREIKVGKSWVSKSANFTNLEALHFDFYAFLHF